MAINAHWDNRDKTFILLEFETEWTFADLEKALQTVDDLIVSVAHRVDVIVDVEGTKIPKDIMSMAKMLLANPEPRANEGNRIVVGANTVIKQGYQLLQKTFSKQLKEREVLFAEDLDVARAILRDNRIKN